MANIKKPARKKGKGLPPEEESSVGKNLSKEPSTGTTTLNFRLPKTFKKRFKQYALDHDVSMVELLMSSFEHYSKD